jgi:hypothetical protein
LALFLRSQAGFDENDSDRKQDTNRDDRGDERRRQRVSTKDCERQRKSDEARIGIAGVQCIDRGVYHATRTPKPDRHCHRKDECDTNAKGRDEAWLPDFRPLRVGNNVEQEGREGNVHDEPV